MINTSLQTQNWQCLLNWITIVGTGVGKASGIENSNKRNKGILVSVRYLNYIYFRLAFPWWISWFKKVRDRPQRRAEAALSSWARVWRKPRLQSSATIFARPRSLEHQQIYKWNLCKSTIIQPASGTLQMDNEKNDSIGHHMYSFLQSHLSKYREL